MWDDNRIKGIIASVAKSFPIGAVMLLETGNGSIKFKTKPIEGVSEIHGQKPELLILDGQQRLTSLYQAIISNKAVTTRNTKGYEIKRWYYIEMVKAMDPGSDLEEAVFSINENKIITKNIGRDIELDLSITEYEYKNLMYPVWMIDEYSVWRAGFNKYWNYDSEKSKFWDEFEEKIINNFNHYMLPVIRMTKVNPKEAVCHVFEKVNTGGVSLSVFELLTASFDSEEFDLKTVWLKIKSEFKPYRILDKTSNIDIIQAITIYSTYQKRKEFEANFTPSRLHTLHTRNSAAYKGVYALLLEDNTKDWLSATKIDFSTYFSESVDIHHIFPVEWCEKKENNILRNDYDCIINKTPLSGRTNRIVSGDAPSKYLERLKKHAGVPDAEFDAILKSHAVNPDFLYNDDFNEFFTDRKERILSKIEAAMGKAIVRSQTESEEGEFIDNDIEEIIE
ncbi:MAG: DUF262 domain-containing protein [Bacteroidales bacterium]|nr:DUF262 domain-containing protein [Bacteroidales bacterium]